MAYSDKVVDHYENPRNVGSFEKGDDSVGTGMVGAPACGDVMKLQIKVNPATGLIEDAKFKTYGCGSAIASSSLVTEWVKGKSLDEALTIKNTHIAEELALPPVKIHCSILAEDAIKAAVQDYKAKPGTAPRPWQARPDPMAVTLTEAAARHVSRYIAKRGKGVGVRLGVKTTGCSGLAYKLEYADDVASEDVVFEDHGVKVLIDPKSLPYIDGTQLDFVREGLNEGFKFSNPREKDRCGCGESFRV
jgi:nitrogen fixation NifU-like protein